MSNKDSSDIASLQEDEAESIDADRDAPITGSKVIRGRGRSKALQIRLNPDELAGLERIAESRGLPTCTVAWEAILDLVRPGRARDALSARMQNDFSRFLLSVARHTAAAERSATFSVPVDVDASIAGGSAELRTIQSMPRDAFTDLFTARNFAAHMPSVHPAAAVTANPSTSRTCRARLLQISSLGPQRR